MKLKETTRSIIRRLQQFYSREAGYVVVAKKFGLDYRLNSMYHAPNTGSSFAACCIGFSRVMAEELLLKDADWHSEANALRIFQDFVSYPEMANFSPSDRSLIDSHQQQLRAAKATWKILTQYPDALFRERESLEREALLRELERFHPALN